APGRSRALLPSRSGARGQRSPLRSSRAEPHRGVRARSAPRPERAPSERARPERRRTHGQRAPTERSGQRRADAEPRAARRIRRRTRAAHGHAGGFRHVSATAVTTPRGVLGTRLVRWLALSALAFGAWGCDRAPGGPPDALLESGRRLGAGDAVVEFDLSRG